MSTAPVTDVGEVSIDGVRYPAPRGVMPYLLNQQVPQVNIAQQDPGLEDRVSKWNVRNMAGGAGKYRIDIADGETPNRFWDSCMRTDQDELGLLPLPTELVDLGATVACIKQWGSATYFAATTIIRRWNGTNVQFYCTDHTTWETHPVTAGHTAQALPANAVSMTIWNGNLLIWCGTDYVAYDGGTTWNTDTTNVSFAVVFDSTVIGIDSDGLLKSSTDPEVAAPTWTTRARIYDDTPTGMTVYEDGNGDPAIYIGTIRGPYVYDGIATDNVYPIMVRFGDGHADNCRGIGVWNNMLVFGKGGNVRQWVIQGREGQAADIGPQRDDGLPSSRVGRIAAIETTLEQMLIAAIDAGSNASSIMLYDGVGWHTLAVAMQVLTVTAASNASPIVITAAGHGLADGDIVTVYSVAGNTAANGTWIVTRVDADTFSLNGSTGSGAYTSGGSVDTNIDNESIRCLAYETHSTIPRLFWGQGNSVWTLPLHDISANPQTAPSSTYRSHGYLVTPWIGIPTTRGVALDIRFRCKGLSDDEQVDVYAAYDGDDTTWTAIGTAPRNGNSLVKFSNLGQEFYTIRLLFIACRGTTNTNQPRTQDAVLRWTLAPKSLWGYGVELDLSGPYLGKGSGELEAALMDSANGLPVIFSYRPDDDRYVKIEQCRAITGTGHDDRGRWQVTLAEQVVPEDDPVAYFNWDGASLWDGASAWT